MEVKVVVFVENNNKVYGKILEDFDYSEYIGPRFNASFKEVLLKRRQFCLIERRYHEKVKDGQLWQCVVEREIIDRKGNRIKVVKPVELIHEHSLSFLREDRPIFSIVSGFSREVFPVEQEIRSEEYRDEFIHYIESYPILRGYCPYCNREIVRDDFAKKRQIIYQASVNEIISYWKQYLGTEYDEVVKKWYQLQGEINRINHEYDKRRSAVIARIEELKRAGMVSRRLTKREREEMYRSMYDNWMRLGGDPFEEPEISDIVYEIVDYEKHAKAQEKIQNLRCVLSELDQEEEEKIKEVKKRFYENEKVASVLERAHYLLTKRVYPCILEAISKYDPYFFEFTSLDFLPAIEAVELVFRACKKNLEIKVA
jgi:DNA-binding Lrp family transcriptional regulator